VLRRIHGPKRAGITKYHRGNQMKGDKMGRACSKHGRDEKCRVGKPKGKRPLGRPRQRWENITMDLRGIWWEGVDLMHLAQDRNQWQALVNMAVTLWVPEEKGNFFTS
jgi:hypothetical protein